MYKRRPTRITYLTVNTRNVLTDIAGVIIIHNPRYIIYKNTDSENIIKRR